MCCVCVSLPLFGGALSFDRGDLAVFTFVGIVIAVLASLLGVALVGAVIASCVGGPGIARGEIGP